MKRPKPTPKKWPSVVLHKINPSVGYYTSKFPVSLSDEAQLQT